jgi:lysophospholipase L1-like esterase
MQMHASGLAVAAMVAARMFSLAFDAETGATMQPGTSGEPRSIVILGASYARSWGTPPLAGYPMVVNRGASGEETGDMLKRFGKDVVAAAPDAVLIWGHVNDITRAKPERLDEVKAATRRHYLEMIRLSRAAGIEVILATEVPWTEPTGMLNDLRAWIGHLRGKQSYASRVSGHVREINDFLRKLAAQERLTLLDFERVFAADGGTRRPEYAAEDGSHISRAGYDALTKHAARAMQSRRQPSAGSEAN